MKVEILGHASVKLIGSKTIYIDPFKITNNVNDADYIFITHDHYDHYDEDSINNIKNDKTKIIVPQCLKDKQNNMLVEPNNEYQVDDLKFKTIPSYNTNKPYHQKEKGYVGYNIIFEDGNYYAMGDTDETPEALEVTCDVCFVPIGGTYTMDYIEAANYINKIKPKKVYPIHYGVIVGDKDLGIKFKEKINKEIEVEL